LYFVGLRKDEKAKNEAPLDEAPRVGEGQQLVGHEDSVDDVDDAVGLEDVRGDDGGHASLGVSEHDLTAGHGGSEVLTLNGLERGLAAALLDHVFELLRADTACYDVIGEDLDESVFVLGLDESLDGAGRKFGEGIICWREDGEWAGAVECVDEAASLDGCNEGFVDRRVDRVLDDGFGGIHVGAADGRVLLCVRAERGEGQGSDGQCCEKCLLHCRYPLIDRFLISVFPVIRVFISIYVSLQRPDCFNLCDARNFLLPNSYHVVVVMRARIGGRIVDAVKTRVLPVGR
jgi:hypothetical protein